MTKETDYFIYLIERYASHISSTAPDVLREWDKRNLTERIYDSYEIYHCERLQNAFDDIQQMMKEQDTCIG